MTEIGGYFGLEEFVNKEFYSDLIAVNNARNALLYILKAKNVKKLFIPYYLCDSISKLCSREGYDYEYYHIGENFLPVFDKKLINDEYLYIVNYYGQISNEYMRQQQAKHGNIIIDNVQAFFQKPVDGIDTVYSCRKFFGVPDGGYVSTDKTLEESIPVDISMDRMKHILGRFEGTCSSDYYSDFKKNEDFINNLELRLMSKVTRNILRGIDYLSICQKREENFTFLHEKLKSLNQIKILVPVGPFAYPFFCKNGINIRKKLAEKKIYVATLWPDIASSECSLEKTMADNILPLPCDQRYGKNEMQYILSILIPLLVKQ